MQYASPDTYAHLSDSNRASSGGSANIGTPPKLYGRLQGSDSAVGQRRQKLQTRTRTAGTGPGVTVHCLKVCVFYYSTPIFFCICYLQTRTRTADAGWVAWCNVSNVCTLLAFYVTTTLLLSFFVTYCSIFTCYCVNVAFYFTTAYLFYFYLHTAPLLLVTAGT